MRDSTTIKRAASQFFALLERSVPVRIPGVRKDFLAAPALCSMQELEATGFSPFEAERAEFVFANVSPEVIWPIASGLVRTGGLGGEVHMTCIRATSVPLSKTRGIVRGLCPRHVLRIDGVIVYSENNGLKVGGASELVGWVGGKWRMLDTGILDPRKKHAAEYETNAAVCSGLALNHRYEWAVNISKPGSIGIRFAVPVGAIASVFRSRERGAQDDRRDALLNWVAQHWRADWREPDDEVYVRRHLRGSDRFKWAGFDVRVIPSQFDVDQRDRLAEQRKEMGSNARRARVA